MRGFVFQVESTPDQCSSKWKALRDKYVKELRKVRRKKAVIQALRIFPP